MDWLDRVSLIVGTFWLDRGAFILASLMIPYGIAIIIWPRLHGSKLTWIRWTGLLFVINGALILADHLHLIGPR
ncbi:MAG TPA: hypothetical protein VGF77_17580 [Allosphingosinicella sp.]|jgi:hypothetical protein